LISIIYNNSIYLKLILPNLAINLDFNQKAG